ncbi:MAG: serine/threonine-protein phosphatase [Acidobacteria bacterium]|nr:serine/threonine-protein phosphatase [Acidobacteriota bacterium]
MRARNEDQWYANPERGIFLVTDGMGGQSAGDLSAKVVVTSLPSMIRRNMEGVEDLADPEVAERLVRIMAELSGLVHQESQDEPALRGMGATVALLLVRQDKALIGHIGDSRIYLFRHGRLSRLTKDHSLVQILVDFGEITPAEAAVHPIRGQITQFVGMAGQALPEVQLLYLSPRDRLLLCTDGLTEMLPDEHLQRVLRQTDDPADICRQLGWDANDAGGRDNITVVVVDWRP